MIMVLLLNCTISFKETHSLSNINPLSIIPAFLNVLISINRPTLVLSDSYENFTKRNRDSICLSNNISNGKDRKDDFKRKCEPLYI